MVLKFLHRLHKRTDETDVREVSFSVSGVETGAETGESFVSSTSWSTPVDQGTTLQIVTFSLTELV